MDAKDDIKRLTEELVALKGGRERYRAHAARETDQSV
jgi:hypothetical protein